MPRRDRTSRTASQNGPPCIYNCTTSSLSRTFVSPPEDDGRSRRELDPPLVRPVTLSIEVWCGLVSSKARPASRLLPINLAAFSLFYGYSGERERVCECCTKLRGVSPVQSAGSALALSSSGEEQSIRD